MNKYRRLLMPRLSQIKARIAELQKEAERIINNNRQATIKDIKAKLIEYNISMEELQKYKRKVKPTSAIPTPVKYRKSEHEYWAGRGPKPKWIKEIEKSGEDLEKYRVLEQKTQ